MAAVEVEGGEMPLALRAQQLTGVYWASLKGSRGSITPKIFELITGREKGQGGVVPGGKVRIQQWKSSLVQQDF